MSDMDPDTDSGRRTTAGVFTPSPGRERLEIAHDRAVEIVERLRETHVDITGHAFLLRLDTLIVRLGARWEIKRELVFEHLKTAFERLYQEPNWCIQVHEDAWMGMLPEIGSRKGALVMTQIWRDLCGFFVGDMSALEVPLYEVLVEDVDCFSLSRIDLRTWFDSAEVDDAPVGERKATHVDRIGPAVFGKPGAGDPVAAAAVEVVIGLDRAQAHAGLDRARYRFFAHPGGEGFRHGATQIRRRIDLDARRVRQQHRVEPHNVAAAASAGAYQPRHRLDGGHLCQPFIARRRLVGHLGRAVLLERHRR